MRIVCGGGLFFFSSRRRHTSWTGDWSSDVCSSDLGALDLEPAELRRRNFVRPEQMPYDVGARALGTEIVYDSGDYPRLLGEVLALAHVPTFRERQRRARKLGRYLGLGIACFVEKAGLGPWEMARVEVDETGGVLVFTGCASLGQGVETCLAQIVADQL